MGCGRTQFGTRLVALPIKHLLRVQEFGARVNVRKRLWSKIVRNLDNW